MTPPAFNTLVSQRLRHKFITFAQTLVAPPIFPADPEKTRRARLLNSIFLVAILAMGLLVFGNGLGHNTPPLAIEINLVLMALTLGCYGLLRRGWIRFTSYAWMVLLIVAVTVGSAILGTIRTPTPALFFPILVAAGLLVDRRTMLLGTVLSALAVGGLIYAENAGWLPTPNYSVSVTQWITYAIGFGLVSTMVYFSVRETRRALGQAKVELLQRQAAETALYQLTNELGERVRNRTRDMSTANAQLQIELGTRHQREQELALRLQVTRLLADAKSLHAIAVTILQTIGEALNWQAIEFYLFDEQNTRVAFSVHWWDRDPQLREFVETSDEIPFPFNTGLPHEILTTGQPVWLPDASAVSRVNRAQMLQRVGLRGGAGFPIQIGGTVCGMFFIFSRDVRPYDAAQVELLNQIGSELSQFIIRTRSEKQLHDAQAQLANQVFELESSLVKINAMHSITQDGVRDLSLNELLQGICDTLVDALKADRVALITLDVETKHIQRFVKSGSGADKMMQVSFDELWDGLSGWAIRAGRAALSPKNVPDSRESAAVQRRRAETECGSILVMPLLYQDELLGTLTAINRPDQKDFDISDVELIHLIANQAATTVEHKRDQETMRYQNEFLSALNLVTLDLLNHKQRDELMNAIVQAATRLLDTPFGAMLLLDGNELLVVATSNPQSSVLGERVTHKQAPLSWQAFDRMEPAVMDNYSEWQHRRDVFNDDAFQATADFPIVAGGKALGVLALARTRAGHIFDTDQIRYGGMFAQLAALVLENLELRESLREETLRDPLTGLYNRRFMREWLNGELQRAARQGSPTSLLMLDVDYFKQFNDTYGHPAGDLVLTTLGTFLTQHLRGGDVACRYGGEEFLVILPGVSPVTAVGRAEQIRTSIQALEFSDPQRPLPPVTVSLGVASISPPRADADALISAADSALYQAKRAGRNRVEIAL